MSETPCPHGSLPGFCVPCLRARLVTHDDLLEAVRAERDRCARLAEAVGRRAWVPPARDAALAIAGAIRSGGTP